MADLGFTLQMISGIKKVFTGITAPVFCGNKQCFAAGKKAFDISVSSKAAGKPPITVIPLAAARERKVFIPGSGTVQTALSPGSELIYDSKSRKRKKMHRQQQ